KNGSLYPVEIHLQLIKEGKNKRFVAIILDITERKKSEALLKESEGFFYVSMKSLYIRIC
ncbi:MAG: PAS domain S-box protein, partial [Microcoleus sp.]